MNKVIQFEEPEECAREYCDGSLELASVSDARVGWFCSECLTIFPDGSSGIRGGTTLTDERVEYE